MSKLPNKDDTKTNAEQPKRKEIHIILDGPPGHEAGRFVEVEDEHGKSFKAGEWEERGEFWHLVIPQPLAAQPQGLHARQSAAVQQIRSHLANGQPAARVYEDQLHADAEAIRFLDGLAADAYKRTSSVELRSIAHQRGEGRTGMLWIDGKIAAITTVLRNDHNRSVLICNDLRQPVAPDANLIAAAPELLDVCETCLDLELVRQKTLNPDSPAEQWCSQRIAKIKAIIAKATGVVPEKSCGG